LAGICNTAEASCGLPFDVGFACVFATRVRAIGAAELFTYVTKQGKVIQVDDAAVPTIATVDSTVGAATTLAVGIVQGAPGQLAYHPILLELATTLALPARQRYTLD